MEKFKKLGLSEQLLKSIQEEGFEAPREIQEKAIPLALAGKDIIGGSATGSGKTLAFGAGIVEKTVRSEEGFEAPREIQEKAIPLALAGKDIIGGSATGSGKTLAFGAGIVEKTVKGGGIQALILTPTRELAEQVASAIRGFSKFKGLRVSPIYGGVAMSPQIEALERAQIVVGTPGRILDHMRQGTLNLKKVNSLVLDEADRMLDMGFIE